MAAHIVVDLQAFGHLEAQVPWWQVRCARVGITVHVPRWRPVRSASGDKAVQMLQCTEAIEELYDHDIPVHDTVDQLLADAAVEHILLATSQRFSRRFASLAKHAKVTLCCDDERSLLSLSWAMRLRIHSLAELSWREPVAWHPWPALCMEPYNPPCKWVGAGPVRVRGAPRRVCGHHMGRQSCGTD